MLIGEFGTDAYRTTNYPPLVCPGLEGVPDEDAQATWNLGLWNDLVPHLSDRDHENVAIGGLVHEWTDQWWKVAPANGGRPEVQENCGHDANPGGHPDVVANEEYFGIVDIDRQPRRAYDVLRDAFAANTGPTRR